MLSGRLLSYLKKRKLSRNGHSLALVVIRCTTRFHSLSLVVPLVVIHCNTLSFVATLCTIRCHSLSHDVPLICLFINDLCQLVNILQKTEFWICKGLICIKVIMLRSIFEKHKMWLSRTKSLLILSAILWGFCDVTGFCHFTLPFFLQFYKPQ